MNTSENTNLVDRPSQDTRQPNETLPATSYFDVERAQSSATQLAPARTTDTASIEEYDPTTYTKPYSPFYTHPSARPSMEQSKSNIRVELRASEDLEAGISKQSSSTTGKRGDDDDGTTKEWTNQRLSMRSKMGEKKKGLTLPKGKRFNCLAGLPKRLRILIKVLTLLFIMGALTAIVVGIWLAARKG